MGEGEVTGGEGLSGFLTQLPLGEKGAGGGEEAVTGLVEEAETTEDLQALGETPNGD